MSKYKKVPTNYFIRINFFLMVVILLSFYLLLVAWLNPNDISSTYLGKAADYVTFVGQQYNHIPKVIVLATVVAHVGEATCSVYLCQKLNLDTITTLAWFLQTAVFGFFSLRFLIWPQLEHTFQGETANKSD